MGRIVALPTTVLEHLITKALARSWRSHLGNVAQLGEGQLGSCVSQSDGRLELEQKIWALAKATEFSSVSKLCENDDWELKKGHFLLFYF